MLASVVEYERICEFEFKNSFLNFSKTLPGKTSKRNTLELQRVPGCNGKGNIKSSKNTHVFAKQCPYESESWKTSTSVMINIPDRVKPEDIPLSVENFSNSVSIVPREDKNKQNLKLNKIKSYNSNKPKRTTRINNKLKNKFKKKIPNSRSKTAITRAVEVMTELENIKDVNDYTSYGYGYFKPSRLNVWTRHNVLQGIPIFSTTDARKWPVKEVVNFVERIVTNNYTDNNPSERIKISKSFINQEIDGDAFLMLTQKDLTDILNINLGPALKLHNAIVVLRQRASAFDISNGLL